MSVRTPALRLVALAAGLSLALTLPAATAAPRPAAPDVASPSVALELPAAPDTVVDADLAADLAAGAAAGILAWDPAEASRSDVAAHLEASGVGFQMLGVLDMAIACMAGPSDLSAVTDAPGAISVYGDEVLTPALSQSVPTAFNGDPEAVWNGMSTTGDGVTIAVIDTGVDATHPDLTWHDKTVANHLIPWSHREVLGPNNDACVNDGAFYGEDEEDTETESGHGTHLASVAAGDGSASNGRYTGMAPGASILGVAAINAVDFPVGAETQDIQPSLVRAVAAIDFVLLEGLDKNGYITKTALLGFTTQGLYDPFHPLSLSLQYLAEFNITPVMPAGNEGPDTSNCSDAATCAITKYSASPFAVIVGATPKTSRTAIADFSARGDPSPRTIWGDQFRYEPTLVAPGVDVVAALRPGTAPLPPFPGRNRPGATGSTARHRLDLDYQALSGTSISAAHVAGAIALMQEAAVDAKGCFLTFNQVRQLLRDTATPMAFASHEVGAGALDATAATWAGRGAPPISSRNSWDCPA